MPKGVYSSDFLVLIAVKAQSPPYSSLAVERHAPYWEH
ncbi:hypothetical protein CEV32_0873 [Brucella rhizosphaerae]|uniref:Uncharacterized protein n=1 Tax=Brucella rhizosphaerae TaxID=571254 RepID=A0A256FCV7_9HYPH|nr:hypothetical protein CEV32_0873 [Brucella rhizosphaerae]